MIISIITGLNIIVSIILPFLKIRRNFLLANMIATGLSGTIYLLSDLYMGSLVYFIASASSFVQILIGSNNSVSRKKLRIGAAIISVLIIAPLIYTKPTDFLAIIGVIFARSGEAMTNMTWIRGAFLSANLWYLTYSIANDSMEMIAVQITVILFFFISIVYNSRKKTK